MREIFLNKGKISLVDDDIFEYLSQQKWFYHNTGYATRNIQITSSTGSRSKGTFTQGKRKMIRMHCLVYEHYNGEIPLEYEIDHKDENKLNNQLSNLRLATPTENSRNKGKRKSNSSGFKGVCHHKRTNKWRAQLRVDGKDLYLGLFDTKEEAYNAYKQASIDHHKDFSNFS